MRVVLIIFGTLCLGQWATVFGAEEDLRDDEHHAYCFKFTWLGPKSEVTTTNSSLDCSKWPGQPCIKPPVFSNDSTLPNVEYMWNNLNRSDIACQMWGYNCIKYSYIKNDEIVRTSYFCGKMSEGKTAVNDGCYTQKVNGDIIEACVCTSTPGQMPCNYSAILTTSIPTLILSAVFYCLITRTHL